MSMNSDTNNCCLICTSESYSMYNGVNSCRACAAFFRRSLLTHHSYRCKRGNRNCRVKQEDKSYCKYCRFQKCKKFGMVIKNMSVGSIQNEKIDTPIIIQKSKSPTLQTLQLSYNEEVIVKQKTNETIINKKETNGVIILNHKANKEKKVCPYFNADELKIKVNDILNNKMFFYKSRKYGTCLQTIMDGIDNLNNDLGFNKPNSISIMKKIELRKYIEHCQKFIVSSPNILMNLEEFSSLSKNDKGIIFSLFRGNAFILLIADYTLKLYDPFSTPKPLLIIDSSTMFNVDDVEFIEPDISQKASNEAYNLYKPSLIFACEHVLKPMKILNFEKIEIAYMILQIIFSNVVLEKTSKECRRVADCLLKIANNELHNYYIFNKKITNYAYRLSEMTKLLYTIKEYCEREKEVVLLAKWLNILDLSFISGV